MALYREHVLPCLTHLASNRRLIEYRRWMVSQARGRVLEIGIGSGLNLSFYGGQVTSVYGIDPSAALLRRASGQPVTRAELAEASLDISSPVLAPSTPTRDNIIAIRGNEAAKSPVAPRIFWPIDNTSSPTWESGTFKLLIAAVASLFIVSTETPARSAAIAMSANTCLA